MLAVIFRVITQTNELLQTHGGPPWRVMPSSPRRHGQDKTVLSGHVRVWAV